MPLWRVVRYARAALFALSAVLLLVGAFLVTPAQRATGPYGLAIDLLLGLLTVAGIFLSLAVLWSSWVQGVVTQFRVRRLVFARLLLGLMLLFSCAPLFVFATEIHRVVLLLAFAGALIGFAVHAVNGHRSSWHQRALSRGD